MLEYDGEETPDTGDVDDADDSKRGASLVWTIVSAALALGLIAAVIVIVVILKRSKADKN